MGPTWLHEDVRCPGQKDGDDRGQLLTLSGHSVHDGLQEGQEDGGAGPAVDQLHVRVQVGQDTHGQFPGQHVMAAQGRQSVTHAVLCDEGADVNDVLWR